MRGTASHRLETNPFDYPLPGLKLFRREGLSQRETPSEENVEGKVLGSRLGDEAARADEEFGPQGTRPRLHTGSRIDHSGEIASQLCEIKWSFCETSLGGIDKRLN